MTPKMILAIVAAILMAAAISWGTNDLITLRHAAEQNEQRGGVMVATQGGLADTARIDQEQEAFNAGVLAGRDAFKQSKQEAQRHDPATATRAVAAVPDSLRNAYRERRLARERSGCASTQCDKRRPEDSSTKR